MRTLNKSRDSRLCLGRTRHLKMRINYGNKEFPLKTDSIQDNFSIEIGKKYVVFYHHYDETKESVIITECRNLYSIIVLDYIDFYIDLKDNFCSKDKNYLIKNSNHQKVCVATKTKEKLIQRGYGYFIGTLSFNNWIDKFQGENRIYDYNHRCYDSQYKVRGYCLPIS